MSAAEIIEQIKALPASERAARSASSPHKIHKLSAHFGRTIHAVEIEGDLRAVFYVEGDTVVTVDIGSHKVYRG